ncbi:MAG: filamentous hemagglutinin N-terminal domain-containing protein [Microcoleaceae cyanobacterium]
MQRLQTLSTFVSLATSFCCIFQPLLATAQIIPDNSLGNENSIVVPNVDINGINSDRIDGGAIRGSNLFHSFQEFNIDNGRGAYFSNPGNITNILTRVTGNNLSNILGTLGVLGNANLFLINPNGIVFGPNARLDVGGSFFASTADSILFENSVEFAASNPDAPPLLTINIPIGLNFRENPGSIINQAALTTTEDGNPLRDNNGFLTPQGLNVPQNQTLGLIGGNVRFDNGVAISPGSNIEIGGLSEPGIVELNTVGANGNTPVLQFPSNIQQANIALTNESQINIRADDGGDININAGNFEMSGGSIIRAGIDEFLGSPDAQVGIININAQDTVSLTEDSFISNVINTDGIGQPGEINVTANSVLISGGSFLGTQTFGQGNAGDINITVDSLLMTGESLLVTTTFAKGNAGNITIETLQLQITDGAQIVAANFGQGNAGNVTIQASDAVQLVDGGIFSSVTENTTGNAGNITIETPQLQMTDGAQIVAATEGEGNGGMITVKAGNIDVSGSLFLADGLSVNSGFLAGSRASGNAGTVIIEAQRLRLTDGAVVTVAADSTGDAGTIIVRANDIELADGRDPQNRSLLDASVKPDRREDSGSGTGSGGSVIVEAERLVLRNGGRIEARTANGIGESGQVSIFATESVELSGIAPDGGFGAIILTNTTGTADAGDITIITPSFSVRDNSDILTISNVNATGNAGNIRIRATESVEIIGLGIDGNNASLDSSTDGAGNGGNITIETGRLTIVDGGLRTSAENAASGNAGNISVIASEEVVINDSSLLASTNSTGRGGGITISAERLVFNNASVSTGSFLLVEQNIPVGGDAGNINIFASDSVELIDSGIAAFTDTTGDAGNVNVFASNSVELIDSGIAAFTDTTGDAGNVTIQTETLRVLDGSLIFVSSSLPDQQNTPAGGDAGNVDIFASELVELSDSGIFASTDTTGNAGNVTFQTDTLRVMSGSRIFVDSDSSGIPGSIDITATSTLLENQSFLNANSEAGQGGSVRLQSNDIRLFNGSGIFAIGSESGETFDGNIEIDADLLVLLNRSAILTNASSPSGGSNINIQPLDDDNVVIIQSNDSVIFAAGNLTIDSSVTFQPVDVPEVAVTNPNDLIAQEFCRQRGASAFTITGRGGIAVSPNDKADGNQINVDLVEPVLTQPQNTSQQRSEIDQSLPISSLDIVPARGWIRDENGDIILVSYDPTTTEINRQQRQFPQCQS